MSDPTPAVGFLKPQLLTSTVVPIQNILVDDPAALVDSSFAYSGGQQTPYKVIALAAQDNQAVGRIRLQN